MTANWTRFCASHSVLAPRSSMTRSVVPSVGKSAARAGRSIPGMVRSASVDIVAEGLVLLELGADLGLVAMEHEAQRRVVPAGTRSPGDHGRRAAVPTLGVIGDAGAARHLSPLRA